LLSMIESQLWICGEALVLHALTVRATHEMVI
jgi:hypothetical protein